MIGSFKDRVFYTIALFGEHVGIAIIILASAWDFLRIGFRGFLEYKIGYLGVVAIWIGLGLIVASKHLDKKEW